MWAGGIKAPDLAKASGLPAGRGGRLEIEPDLSVNGHPNLFVLGDTANIKGGDGTALPQLGSVAQQSGQWAARNILADLDNEHRTAFHYKDKGIMAMIGRGAAVAEVGEHRHELHGTFAFAAWLGVHAMLLSGVRQRIDAFVSWGWDYFSRSRTAALLGNDADHQIDWGDDEPSSPDLQPAVAMLAVSRAIPDPYPSEPPPTARHPGGQGAGYARTLRRDHRRHRRRWAAPWPIRSPPRESESSSSSGETSSLGRRTTGHRMSCSWTGRYISPDIWFDADGKQFQPQVHYFVGGATKLYGAALYRLRPEDFGELDHIDGVSPAWPLGYGRLRALVHQGGGALPGARRTGEDPTEGPFFAPVSGTAPVSHEPRIQEIADALKAKGYHPFSAPVRHPARRGPIAAGVSASAAPVRRLSLPGPCQGRRRHHGRTTRPSNHPNVIHC